MKKVAIIGAGLAGASCAYFLQKENIEVTIFDAASDVASGASGNDVGLYNPRFSAFLTPQGRFYKAAFMLALDVLADFGDAVDFNPCGNLALITNTQKETRYRKMLQHWGWDETMAQALDAQQVSDVAGVSLQHDALYLKQSGMVCPRKLCASLAKGADIRLGQGIVSSSDPRLDGFDAVIVACGAGVFAFAELAHLPLKPVRGQITYVEATAALQDLKVTLGYGGYVAPAQGGVCTMGATFDRGVNSDILKDADDLDNIGKLRDVLDIPQSLKITGHRASVRVANKDHFPVIGRVENGDRAVYVSLAHGSHGILSGLLGGRILAHEIMGQALVVDDEVLAQLSPSRYK